MTCLQTSLRLWSLPRQVILQPCRIIVHWFITLGGVTSCHCAVVSVSNCVTLHSSVAVELYIIRRHCVVIKRHATFSVCWFWPMSPAPLTRRRMGPNRWLHYVRARPQRRTTHKFVITVVASRSFPREATWAAIAFSRLAGAPASFAIRDVGVAGSATQRARSALYYYTKWLPLHTGLG